MTKPIRRLRRAVRGLPGALRGLLPGAVVLLYHRVSNVAPDPFGLCVHPRRFDEHLDALGRHARPMRLTELVGNLREGHVPRRAVAITFDDGYADNLAALPSLQRHNLPATLFVATGYMEHAREFWWDVLARILLQPGTLPPSLKVTIAGQVKTWRLDTAAAYEAEAFDAHRGWTAYDDHDPTPRHSIYRDLWRLLRPLPADEQARMLKQLTRWAGVDASPRPTHRPLTPDELRRVAETDLVDIGAHTISHVLLSALTPVAQRAEIDGSRAWLENLLKKPVTGFAYPYGSTDSHGPDTADTLRATGFAYACTTVPHAMRRGTDLYHIPRLTVENWDGDELLRRVTACLRA